MYASLWNEHFYFLSIFQDLPRDLLSVQQILHLQIFSRQKGKPKLSLPKSFPILKILSIFYEQNVYWSTYQSKPNIPFKILKFFILLTNSITLQKPAFPLLSPSFSSLPTQNKSGSRIINTLIFHYAHTPKTTLDQSRSHIISHLHPTHNLKKRAFHFSSLNPSAPPLILRPQPPSPIFLPIFPMWQDTSTSYTHYKPSKLGSNLIWLTSTLITPP